MIFSPIDEIKSRLDIVDVVSQYMKLQKVGVNFRAPCPFHSEKKPSFFVNPSRQIWHCFGSCSEGGDIFKFVMKIEGMEFADALRVLAQKAGVELRKQDPKIISERKRLYEICELSCKFFEKQLSSTKTKQKAKEYLIKRGINKESIEKWRLGYSPEMFSGLSDFLIDRGYKKEEIVKTGLAIKRNNNELMDRFSGRIIFPIFDLNSQVIGFGGRILDSKDIAKYVNIPNTLLYDKSQVLYGLDKARIEIRKKDSVILVEGYTDAILASQAGFENVVGTCGTALSSFQLNILKRYSENILTAFDMDIAGDSATKKGIDLAISHGFNVKVILMPEGKDPADVILENPKEWQKLISTSNSILDFYFKTTISRFDKKTPEGKKEISKILLPVLKRIPNKIEQSHWIQILSKELEVREEVIEAELRKYKLSGLQQEKDTEEDFLTEDKNQETRKEKLEERIISLVLKYPKSFSLIKKEDFKYFSPKIQKALVFFKKSSFSLRRSSSKGKSLDFKKAPSELREFLDHLIFAAEIENEEIDYETEIKFCLKEIKSFETKDKLDEISKEIKKAEEKKDFKKVKDLMEKFNKIAQKLYEKS